MPATLAQLQQETAIFWEQVSRPRRDRRSAKSYREQEQEAFWKAVGAVDEDEEDFGPVRYCGNPLCGRKLGPDEGGWCDIGCYQVATYQDMEDGRHTLGGY